MIKIAQYIFHRGAKFYARVRIPTALGSAYPPDKTHIIRTPQATNAREAKVLGHAALARIYADFDTKRGSST